jgi:hypothetical protein
MWDAEDEDDGDDVHDETDATETNIHPRIIIPESYCELDIEIDSNNDFSSEDDEPLSSIISTWGKTYDNCIKCPDFAEYVEVLGKVKNDGGEMAL